MPQVERVGDAVRRTAAPTPTSNASAASAAHPTPQATTSAVPSDRQQRGRAREGRRRRRDVRPATTISARPDPAGDRTAHASGSSQPATRRTASETARGRAPRPASAARRTPTARRPSVSQIESANDPTHDRGEHDQPRPGGAPRCQASRRAGAAPARTGRTAPPRRATSSGAAATAPAPPRSSRSPGARSPCSTTYAAAAAPSAAIAGYLQRRQQGDRRERASTTRTSERRRQEPPGAARVERRQARSCPVALELADEQPGDQEAGEDEEDVDTDEAARTTPGMPAWKSDDERRRPPAAPRCRGGTPVNVARACPRVVGMTATAASGSVIGQWAGERPLRIAPRQPRVWCHHRRRWTSAARSHAPVPSLAGPGTVRQSRHDLTRAGT